MKKRTLFIMFVYLFSSSVLFAQDQKEELYLFFKEDSPDFYWKKGEMGEKFRTSTYLKNQRNNGDIYFYINGLLFIYDKSEMEQKNIPCSEIESKDFLTANEVEKHIQVIQKKYPLGYKYPSKEYPIMFIVNKEKDKVTLYEVKWQYYVE